MSTYFRERRPQGVGAIAAAAPPPRSAPAPTIGSPTFSREARRADPMLNLPRRVRWGAPSDGEVLPGVIVRSASLVRPAVLMSGVRRGQPPGGGYGRTGMGAINLEEDGHTGGGTAGGGGGRPPPPGRGSRLSARAQTAGMKPSAYVPPIAPLSTTVVAVSGRRPGFQTAPPRKPQIGAGIGQSPGVVITGAPPSPYGPGVSSPTVSIGGGVGIHPTLEEYGTPLDVGVQTAPIQPTLVTAVTPSSPISGRTMLLIGGGALALYLLTRKRKNPARRRRR